LLVLLLGGAAVLVGDGDFIKWKPTMLNWLFSIVFLSSQFFGSKNIIQHLMADKLD